MRDEDPSRGPVPWQICLTAKEGRSQGSAGLGRGPRLTLFEQPLDQCQQAVDVARFGDRSEVGSTAQARLILAKGRASGSTGDDRNVSRLGIAAQRLRGIPACF